MADNSKYINILRNTASGNFQSVNGNSLIYKIAMMVIKQNFSGKVNISASQWEELGKPEAERHSSGYYLDLSNRKTLAMLLMKTSYEAMKLACYAATDITDAINSINNDNLDHILTDREAMVAVSQVMLTAMDGFKNMDNHVNDVIRGKV